MVGMEVPRGEIVKSKRDEVNREANVTDLIDAIDALADAAENVVHDPSPTALFKLGRAVQEARLAANRVRRLV